jgi:hypothetical protein
LFSQLEVCSPGGVEQGCGAVDVLFLCVEVCSPGGVEQGCGAVGVVPVCGGLLSRWCIAGVWCRRCIVPVCCSLLDSVGSRYFTQLVAGSSGYQRQIHCSVNGGPLFSQLEVCSPGGLHKSRRLRLYVGSGGAVVFRPGGAYLTGHLRCRATPHASFGSRGVRGGRRRTPLAHRR